MIPEIKKLHSPDIMNLETYKPLKKDCFCFLLQVIAGPKGMEGEESFDVKVCTPQWLMNNIKNNEIIMGRHYLILQRYNYDLISQRIDSFCHMCEGKEWKECAEKLGRLGKWEYEDYQE
jgi:hypothetical protein